MRPQQVVKNVATPHLRMWVSLLSINYVTLTIKVREIRKSTGWYVEGAKNIIK